MKKLFLFAACAAVALTSCTQSEELTNSEEVKNAIDVPVAFGTYVGENSTSRAGQTGIMDLTALQKSGFGVFGTYSDDDDYASTQGPNYMYNQAVTYASSAWGYTPIKYWPNETTNDSQSPAATSAKTDKLSFFAYAPYVATASVSGTEGITAISANNVETDPIITYAIAAKPADNVDLCWGVAPTGGLSYTAVNGSTITVAEGMPLVNLVKPGVSTTLKFNFKHALARLGLTVVGAFDQVGEGGTLEDGSKVTIESVTITATGAWGTEGELNLKNTSEGVPNWNITKASESTLTVNKDNNLNPALLDAGDKAIAEQPTGVTASEQKLINDGSSDQYFTVIPAGEEKTVSVTITYYVETTDEALAKKYSRVKNVITKTANLTFEAGKAYNLKLILGLTEVKMEATIDTWGDATTETVIDLPKNNE